MESITIIRKGALWTLSPYPGEIGNGAYRRRALEALEKEGTEEDVFQTMLHRASKANAKTSHGQPV
jgi:hypothetical protein